MVQEDLVVVVGGGIVFLGRDVVFWLFCVFVQSCPAMEMNCSTVGGPLCEAADARGNILHISPGSADSKLQKKFSFHFRVW